MKSRSLSVWRPWFSLLSLILWWSVAFPVVAQVDGNPSERVDLDRLKAIEHLESIGVELYRNDDDEIVDAEFLNSTAVDDDIRYLAKIDTLQTIDFGQRDFSNRAMGFLSELKELKKVNLSLCPISNEGLLTLSAHRELKSLDLTGTRITNFMPLIRLEKLKSLELQYCAVTDAQMRHVARLTSLEELNLCSTEITDQGVKLLHPLVNLRSLSLCNARVTDESVEALASLPSLEYLGLAYGLGKGFQEGQSNLSAVALSDLKRRLDTTKISGLPKSPTIVTLEIAQDWSSASKYRMLLEDFWEMPDKEDVLSVDLSRTLVDDKMIANIEAFPNLESLNLSCTWITDAGLESIAKLRYLKSLDLSQTRVSDSGIPYLAACNKLSILQLEDTMVTGNTFGELAGLKELVELNVSRGNGSTKWPTRLHVSRGLNDQGLKEIAKLKSLKRVSIETLMEQTEVTDAGVRYLLQLDRLTNLDCCGHPVEESTINEFKKRHPNVEFEQDEWCGGFGFGG